MKIDLPIPEKPFTTRKGYQNFIRRYFEQRGFTIHPAKFDAAGNCEYCGEAGRCPGVHGIRFDYCLGTSEEF